MKNLEIKRWVEMVGETIHNLAKLHNEFMFSFHGEEYKTVTDDLYAQEKSLKAEFYDNLENEEQED